MKPETKKKTLAICIPVFLIVLAGILAGTYYFPLNKVYRDARESGSSLPFSEAVEKLQTASNTLSNKPLFHAKAQELSRLLAQITITEIDRAISENELDYAEALLGQAQDSVDEALLGDRAQRIRTRHVEETYALATALEKDGREEEALEAFLAIKDYADAEERAKIIRARLDLSAAKAVFTGSNYDEGIAALMTLQTDEATECANALSAEREERRETIRTEMTGKLSAGAWHSAGIASDGSVWLAGDSRYAVPHDAADRIVSGLTSFFLLRDGRVYPQGETFGAGAELEALADVIDIAPGLTHALVLRRDGTVVGVGSKAFDRLGVEDWQQITDVVAGAWHSIGLRADGTATAVGDNHYGQCGVEDWTQIAAVEAGLWHSVGLKTDGTVIACGDNTYGQCEVSDWSEIVAIDCGACFTVGLRKDGTVVACGDNAAGQCEVTNWTEVAAVSAGAYHTIAVRMDGSLLTAGLLPDGALPDKPLFASDWELEPVAPKEPTSEAATAYMEGMDRETGPWLYLDRNGAVLICIDDSEERSPFRADLLATSHALPCGRVTEPNATGTIIRMISEMPEIQARKAHAVLAFTGDYLGFTANRKAVMMRNGIVYYDRAETSTLAIQPDGTLAYYPMAFLPADQIHAETLLAQGVRDSFSFGPLLVKDGKVMLLETPENTLVTMRVALGYTDPFHYISVVSLRDRKKQLSHIMMANIMTRYGVQLAYNFDGGHSTSLVFMGKELSLLSLIGEKHGNIRSLSDIVMFLENDAVQPLPNDVQP